MLDWLLNWGNRPKAGAQPTIVRGDRPGVPIPLNVALIVHDPPIPERGNLPLSKVMGWYDPEVLAAQYIADLRICSGGIADYRIVVRRTFTDFPVKIDGFRYNSATYLAAWERRIPFHQPDEADYERLLAEIGLGDAIDRGEIDEIWLFGFPYAGYYESRMIGPAAFWCNAPPLHIPAARRYIVMGFNVERDVGCMLENFGHRVESIMTYVYRHHPAERNLWTRFTRLDECGNVHFAPSSTRDYDWGNPRRVESRADAWYQFPDLSAPPRLMDCAEWGNGDMRLHHLWWLDHLPRVAGETDGVLNNWWHYILQPWVVQ
ncbi:MAG TPA: hypothetical protein DEF43_00285 [Chloroflexus aurantiacus]|uniref:Uncharacterized protein n=1 Tax=Chloroflexus aurantiacus (strain ATCC 29366 / DSM 635 / J-10-fl) TaxID=324602 RepID=A9WFG4_CHLAA|nr:MULTISPECIES: hypothetical protein [Chloroflexus]ABY33902.1 conserved hypothetical protein [Chloroflexus aurantiacus J-10-fl]RMG50572.1 MAG: hypothetical protein D6716_08250 [Chloroflexota bacterium]HBW65614.1 hypothetical protein [Chloroflexus aurantiacus]